VRVVLGILLLLAAIAIPAVGLASPESDARAVVRRMDNGQILCSVVAVRPGFGYTAAHCAAEGMRIAGQPAAIDVHPDRDFATVRSTGLACPCAEVGTVALDEPVLAVGFPSDAGAAQIVTHGRYQGLDPRDGQLMHTAPLAGGMSGGGLFVVRDGHAYLIGVNVARYDIFSFSERLP
jgi:hypothetical protein